jgi:hypothetical protein
LFHAKAQRKTQRRKEKPKFFFAPLRLPLRLCVKQLLHPYALQVVALAVVIPLNNHEIDLSLRG